MEPEPILDDLLLDSSCSDDAYSEYDPIELSIRGLKDNDKCASQIAAYMHLEAGKFEEAYFTAVRAGLYRDARDIVKRIAQIDHN